jgi:hypothetical protein
LTQWYPHIAVFENGVWHTMPNIDQGEYYNDFADYEVIINTPSDYIVAATGVMVSTEEKANRVERRFVAKHVIDFAWFASPYFIREERQVDVGLDSTVTLTVFY